MDLENWSGMIQFSSSPDTNEFNQTEGNWRQTGFKDYCTDGSATDWVGLGGDETDNGQQRLLQVGTTLDGGYASDPIKPFYQYLTAANGKFTSGAEDEIFISGPNISPGDWVSAEVNYLTAQQSGDGAPNADFYLFDVTSDTSYNAPILYNTSGPDGSYYSGDSAEWIDERPQDTATGDYDELMRWYNANILWSPSESPSGFGNLALTTSNGVVDAAQAGYNRINMTWDGTTLAGNSDITGNQTWSNNWYHSV